jgi:hypothetical protein
MNEPCWCIAYHHPEYSGHEENDDGWSCECCERGHQLPNTKYIDEALEENLAVMGDDNPFVSPYPELEYVSPAPFIPVGYRRPSAPRIAAEYLAPVMNAAGFFITTPRTYVIAVRRPITGQGLIISPTMEGKSALLQEFLQTRPGTRITIWP